MDSLNDSNEELLLFFIPR